MIPCSDVSDPSPDSQEAPAVGQFLSLAGGGESKTCLMGLSVEEMRRVLPAWPGFRCRQVYQGIHEKGAASFQDLTSLPKQLREELAANFTMRAVTLKDIQASVDGTQKWLFRLHDGNEIETVHIPEENRGTVCVSSQVGCTLTCRFCHTGTQTWVRNLTSSEIVSQVATAMDYYGDWATPKHLRHVTHIVFMGMGEPLYNYDGVAAAIRALTDPQGLGFSNRRITLSTSGVVPFIERCGRELGVNLAVSLHAPVDDIRTQIVPLNKKYPLKDLMEACRAYPGVHAYRKITFEYVMLKGVNDTPVLARELAKLLEGLPAKVNLIPFNPWPNSGYSCSTLSAQETFLKILRRSGVTATLRRTRGQEILAACGQLKSDSQRPRASIRT